MQFSYLRGSRTRRKANYIIYIILKLNKLIFTFMRKILKLTLLVMCQIPIVSMAANVTWEENGFLFSADNTKSTCAVTGTSMTGNVVIPSSTTYNGSTYTVTDIASWFIRGHGSPTNYRNTTFLTFHCNYTTGTLVERCKSCWQISREAFFGRHFFHSSGKFT